jgi:hypothetical protein
MFIRWGSHVIPAGLFEHFPATPISQQMRDAAAELGLRIAHGEYDDLDDMQRMDLQSLAQILEHWARRVTELEAAMLPPAAEDRPHRTS